MKKLKIEIAVTENAYFYAKTRLLEFLNDCYAPDDPECTAETKAIRDLENDTWTSELYALLSHWIDICIDYEDSFLRIYINTVMTYLN